MSKSSVKKQLASMDKAQIIDVVIECFLPRIRQVLAWSEECGWGFCDTMPDIFYEYYQEENEE